MARAKGSRGKPARELVTQAEYSRMRKVSREAIRKAVATRRIPTVGPRKLIDPEAADRALRQNTDPSKTRGPGALTKRRRRDEDDDGSGVPGLYESRRKKAFFDARQAEIDVLERLHQLLPAAPVREACHRRDRRIRDQLMAVPDRLAQMLTGNTDQLDVYRKITAEMRAICENLAGPEPIIQEALEENSQALPEQEVS